MATHRTPIPNSSRLVVLARASGRCEKCSILTDRFEIDHILPVAEGGGSSPQNLRALCVPCHRIETRKFMRGHTKAKRIGRKQVEEILVGALREIACGYIDPNYPMEIARLALKRAGFGEKR